MISYDSNVLVLVLSENIINKFSFILDNYIVAFVAKKRLQISYWVNVTFLSWVTGKYACNHNFIRMRASVISSACVTVPDNKA